jgi:probable HAF family extracellular repeat protein
MKVSSYFPLIAIVLFAALAIPTQLTAQDGPNNKPKHHQYKLYDVGTFGGPNGYFWQGYPFSKTLSSRGTVFGAASTPVSDPFYPNCFIDCFVDHAFKYEDGVLTDLGSLGASSNGAIAHSSNQRGWIVGVGENGVIDPSTGFPELRALLWKDGTISDLGTFGGNIGHGLDLNNRGQVVGAAGNSTPDSYAIGIVPLYFVGWPVTTQVRAFLWQHGVMQDLGTLGGE